MSARLAALIAQGGLDPVITPALLQHAARASDDAYRDHTHAAGQSEGLLIDYGDGPIFAVRGTTLDGWCILTGDGLIDVAFLPWCDPLLGWLHHGFLVGSLFKPGGARGLFNAAVGDLFALDQPPVVCGHSKGGAEALIVGGLLAAWGKPPKAIITVDAPKLAIGDRLAKVLAGHWLLAPGVPVLQLRAGRSPVSHVPVMPWWNNGPGQVVDLDPLPPFDARDPLASLPDPEAHKIKHIRSRLDVWLAAAA